jgi:hypothetical protein
MGKPDKNDKPDKDSPLDHDQGQGNDPDAVDNDLPESEETEDVPEAEPKG